MAIDDSSGRPLPSRFRDPRANETARLAFFRRAYRLPAPTDSEIARFRDTLYDGDPLADALVAWIEAAPPGQGRALFARALDRGVDSIPNAPEPMVDFFREVEVRPSWVDDDQLRLASRVALRVGPSGAHVLSCLSLTGGYRSSAANKPLVMTGALEKMAYRRLAETSKFVFDLYDSEALARGSAGYRSAVMVRLMHAMVRARLLRDPRWRIEDWGVPVNQADMLATNLLFSGVFVIGLRMLGRFVSRREADALVHFWRYVGQLMGIAPSLLPHDFDQAASLVYLSSACQPPGDDDSKRLTAALLQVPLAGRGVLPRPLEWFEVQWRAGFSRLVLGDREADELGLPDNPIKYAVVATACRNVVFETLRTLTPGGERVAVAVGRHLGRQYVQRILEGKMPEYQPHDVSRAAHAHPLMQPS